MGKPVNALMHYAFCLEIRISLPAASQPARKFSVEPPDLI